MRIITFLRDKIGRKQCPGICIVQDATGKILFTSQSLERGWLNNKKNISCVPSGTYKIKLEYSPKFNTELWELYGVPNRGECKIHIASFWYDLNGCISLGVSQKDINNDGLVDNYKSKIAMDQFHKVMKGYKEAEIRIINNRF